jgi:putative transposase
VLDQFLRAAREKRFEITAYCFMPDHVHLLVSGLTDDSDCRAFIRAMKQYTGYYFRKATGRALWQRYGYEHVLRSDLERATTIRYILDNPLRAGLAKRLEDYPFLGSERYTLEELVAQATLSDEARLPMDVAAAGSS